jgi:DNA sulfur modification protein DndE
MNHQRVNKVVISATATQKLRTLRIRTGITPNVMARAALALSLNESDQPYAEEYPADGMEFNAYTLFGDLDVLLTALIKENNASKKANDESLPEQVRAHINRGVDLLYPRVRSLTDVGLLAKK